MRRSWRPARSRHDARNAMPGGGKTVEGTVGMIAMGRIQVCLAGGQPGVVMLSPSTRNSCQGHGHARLSPCWRDGRIHGRPRQARSGRKVEQTHRGQSQPEQTHGSVPGTGAGGGGRRRLRRAPRCRRRWLGGQVAAGPNQVAAAGSRRPATRSAAAIFPRASTKKGSSQFFRRGKLAQLPGTCTFAARSPPVTART